MNEDTPKVEPIEIPKYNYKNSKHDMMPNLPARMLCVASSTGGKTVLICIDPELNIKTLQRIV